MSAHRRKISRDDGSHHPIIEEEDEEELDSLDLGTNGKFFFHCM